MEVATTFFKTSSRRLPGDVLNTSSRRCPQCVFQKTSSRHLQRNVLKTSFKRRPQHLFQETSSRPPWDVLRLQDFFLAKAKDTLETIYGLSIYVPFKPLYHSITGQTNWINFNKLKHGNNTEIMKTWFSMNCQTRTYFFQEFKYI